LKKTILIIALSFQFILPSIGQNHDHDSTFRKAPLTHYIAPLVLIGGGLVLNNQTIKNKQITFHNENFKDFHSTLDDYIQFAPHAAVFGLDWIGVKSKHGFTDKVGLMFVGGVITLGVVTVLKDATHQLRPDGSTENSFPSGHTANAFFGATILAEEYADQSILYTIGGYSVATATGVLRVLNNRHWASDVLVGAGVGIISGKLAYIIYPWLKKAIGRKEKNSNISFVPMYDGRTMGGNLIVGF
jgi:membrane-associated phospholipid phosphatase